MKIAEPNPHEETSVVAARQSNDNGEMRAPWHKPAVTRIEIKRTLIESGSGADGTHNTVTG
jgi:hypothetical protein